ncbi:MAG TPA: hypothetical protein VGC55_17685 [Dokdonella sp.]
MTLATLVNIGSLISSIAVLISLVYLNRQLRQGALNQRSKMDRGRSQQVGEWLQYIAQPDTAALILRGHAGDPTLTSLECHRYLWSMYPLFLHFEDSYYQHRDGMISEPQYASIVGHLRSRCPSPGFRALWLHIRERFPADFVGFVDGLLREIPVDDADGSQWTERWRERAAAERARKD